MNVGKMLLRLTFIGHVAGYETQGMLQIQRFEVKLSKKFVSMKVFLLTIDQEIPLVNN